jgi:hypothetical protein
LIRGLISADERSSQQIAEARLLYREWNVYWNRHEYWAQSQVHAGWVNTVGLDLDRGRPTRINRLSLNGVTNVTNDAAWLDRAIAQLFNVTNLIAFMPGNGIPEGQTQEVTCYLLVGNTADYWPVQNDHTEEAADESDADVDGMETVKDDADRPNTDDANMQPALSYLSFRAR